MGVFSYSVHVQHNGTPPVIHSVRGVMESLGFRENIDVPQDTWEEVDVNRRYEQAIRGPKRNHAFYVTKPKNGWASLLCRSQWDMPQVLAALSAAPGTRVLVCDVHDSDFWGNQLYEDGACTDDFNSETASLTADDVLRMLVAGESDEALDHFPHLAGQAQELERMLAERRPPELRKFDQYMESVYGAICDKLLSHQDLDRYVRWNIAEAKAIMAAFPKKFPEDHWNLHKTHEERYASVRHVLRPEVTEVEFVTCLDAMDLAERCLESFLGLCDIPSHFAHLNYEEVGRRGENSLANHGVEIVRHHEFRVNAAS